VFIKISRYFSAELLLSHSLSAWVILTQHSAFLLTELYEVSPFLMSIWSEVLTFAMLLSPLLPPKEKGILDVL